MLPTQPQGGHWQGGAVHQLPGWPQPNFQMWCATPDPAVHQLLETWAGNMQKELEKQTEMTRNMLSSQVKDLHMYLGSKGAPRPYC